jgi:two-component system sensor histidine kinase HydH
MMPRPTSWRSRTGSNTRPLDQAIAPVPLQPLVARCLGEFERELRRRHIQSCTALAADLPAVRGDALLLGQVLSSLLANAIEALDREGEITVRGEWLRGQSQVMLSVQDSGPGMTDAQLRRAGKPFHTTKARGLGVGLALARRVIERFGGRLEIDSEPGRGTTVRLHMPTA